MMPSAAEFQALADLVLHLLRVVEISAVPA